MQIPTHPEPIQVIYKRAGEQWNSTIILDISAPPLAKGQGNKTEQIIRSSIESLTGTHRDVLSDLYRHLVLSNYTPLDGKRGKSAAVGLDEKYPSHGTLPKLKQKSGGFNTLGAIVSILLERETHGERYRDAFSIVGGILFSLLKAGVKPPELDALTSPAPLTPESADIEPPPPARIRVETYRILRDTALARRVKVMHQFKCQISDCHYTMQLPNGSGYAEAHHIRPFGGHHRGGDVIGNILCLCPNHHAELDNGVIALSLATLRRIDDHPIDVQHVEYHNREIHKSNTP
jgi:hypothetical protein